LSPSKSVASGANRAEDLVRVSTRLLEAIVRRDASALEELLDPEFVHLNGNGVRTPRAEFIASVLSSTYTVLEAGNGAYYVAEASIRYLRPARLADDLVVVSTIEDIRAASVVIQQRVIRGDELLTEARVTAAFLDANGRPQRQPKEWIEKFKQIADRQ